MAKSDDKPKRSILRRLLVPSIPSIRPNEGLGVREQGRHFTEGLQATSRTCPNDGSVMTLTTLFQQDEDGTLTNGERAFVCPTCEATIPVSLIVADIRQNLDLYQKAERDYFLFALAMIAVFGILWLTTGYLMTLIGGLLFAFLLLLIAMTYRYRYWQAVHNRMFEKTAPIRDWIKDDLLGR